MGGSSAPLAGLPGSCTAPGRRLDDLTLADLLRPAPASPPDAALAADAAPSTAVRQSLINRRIDFRVRHRGSRVLGQ
jgi:hypothetical protein